MKYKINKEKCARCGICMGICPAGMQFNQKEEMEIINQEELEKCGIDICPMKAIEKVNENADSKRT